MKLTWEVDEILRRLAGLAGHGAPALIVERLVRAEWLRMGERLPIAPPGSRVLGDLVEVNTLGRVTRKEAREHCAQLNLTPRQLACELRLLGARPITVRVSGSRFVQEGWAGIRLRSPVTEQAK